jgi:hypothetical protein
MLDQEGDLLDWGYRRTGRGELRERVFEGLAVRCVAWQICGEWFGGRFGGCGVSVFDFRIGFWGWWFGSGCKGCKVLGVCEVCTGEGRDENYVGVRFLGRLFFNR